MNKMDQTKKAMRKMIDDEMGVERVIEIIEIEDGIAVVYQRLISEGRTIEESILSIKGTWDKFEGEVPETNRLKLKKRLQG